LISLDLAWGGLIQTIAGEDVMGNGPSIISTPMLDLPVVRLGVATVAELLPTSPRRSLVAAKLERIMNTDSRKLNSQPRRTLSAPQSFSGVNR